MRDLRGTENVSSPCERLRELAAHTPAAPGLVLWAGGREAVWTWAELERRTRSTADAIASRTVRPERSVLVTEEVGGTGDVLNLIAMLRTRLPVAVLPGNAPHPARHALREKLLRNGHDLVELREPGIEVTLSKFPVRGCMPADSLLMSSGGSSGKPKVVIDRWMRRTGERPRAARLTTQLNWRAGQRQMIIGSLHHASTLNFLIEGLADGNTLVITRLFEPTTVLDLIAAWDIRWLHLTPYHMRHLVFTIRKRRHDLASLRGLVHLAAPCPYKIKRGWLDLLPPEYVFELYGSTEGIGVTIARGDEWIERPGTVGRGFFTHIRILDSEGFVLPPGETGEIYMRSRQGPRPSDTYLDVNDAMTVTADGFSSVGDRGHLDGDGYLYLTSRQLTRIQVGGETVDPSEVESVLISHPDVLDAGVAGVIDQRLGESLVALVVSTSRDPGSLKQYIRERMPGHKVPRIVRIVDQLPYTDVGKLDRMALSELAERGHVAQT